MILLVVILLFFLLTSLIMLRIHQNVNEEREKYRNLFSLGFTFSKLKHELQKEMATLFFFPFVLGTIISILYTLLSVASTEVDLIFITFMTVTILLIIEYMFYCITTKTLIKKYLKVL